MIENIDICKKCGGRCCKKSGCDYIPKDFNDLSTNGLYEKLKEGNISIVATLKFEKLPNGNIFANPFLYLRARNINRNIIDLLSMKTMCSQLTETGCRYTYEDRPSMEKNLVPVEDAKCYPHEKPMILMQSWESYQKILFKLVKRFTGLTVEERLAKDAEKLFIDVLENNSDGISPAEILDIKNMIVQLSLAYPQELNNAVQKCKMKTYQKR